MTRPVVARSTLSIAVAVLILDQLTKHWALNALADGRPRHVVWTLQWNLSFNRGMAFSQGQGIGPIIGLLAILVIVFLVVTTSRTQTSPARIAAGLLIGGALGNLADRIFRGDGWLHGAVVDFIDFQWFPIFNVADMGITLGAIALLASSMLPERGRSRKRSG